MKSKNGGTNNALRILDSCVRLHLPRSSAREAVIVNSGNKGGSIEENLDARQMRWHKAHPPTLYYNTMYGVTALVRKDDYEAAKALHRRQLRDGIATSPKILPLIRGTFLFYHGSAKQAPAEFKTGMLTDFDDLVEQKLAKVERRRDILVPFGSLKGDFSMTIGKDRQLPLYLPSGDEVERLIYAVNYLLKTEYPANF